MIANKQFKELLEFTEKDPGFVSKALNPALILLPENTVPGTGTVLDTRNGWLELITDGEKLWVEGGN